MFYYTCTIRGEPFVVVTHPLKSDDTLTLDAEHYHVIFLDTVKAEKRIKLKAISVIALKEITSLHGRVRMDLDGKNLCFKPLSDHKGTEERLKRVTELFRQRLNLEEAITETVDAFFHPFEDKRRNFASIEASLQFLLEPPFTMHSLA